MDFYIGDKEEVLIETRDLMYFSETRLINIPRKIVMNFFQEDRPVGFVSFDVRWINRNAYITYYVISEARGIGLGKKMLLMAMDFAFNELNLNRLTAEVYEYNKPSIKLLESTGFELEGVIKNGKFYNGKYHNIRIYGYLRR
ncbi:MULTISPECIES: GNAT family N-acetyltransferase [Pseudothermotoga]|jgi:RimJ/RimL family protein N-acetyltransferase|uniref:GCN5-related N-acetyltransferase n=1 Tax=Pseudothermotoga lettingae (strain ATCC BAA-301 / DSM 14385 / NBRC 107922 / TMO) TaxID=416591 RepID=A8F3H8_PSELT|nr:MULTISPECIES: GNAT family protein [Pseudothermotoga]ABV32712.1 GCN5-related N-acetyltransferase [Pseudothermotoga lettingae TMO]KUK20053.1 MAG: GCN5-related N-acetyltransferase [Pseudothermotoga lettingae]MDI3495526.1 hypothetical protein [Pseudothermotoga sp.]MDK2885281.1 hypothetical protein [Pseudothermotoga sp.]GLI48295.1 hypothetical protein PLETTINGATMO_04640 [Pseudothermotoga lettingae TMO]